MTGKIIIDGKEYAVHDVKMNLPPIVDARWMVVVPWPGYGDISDREHQAAADLGIATVDQDLGLPSPFYASEDDALRVAAELTRRNPGKVFGVASTEATKNSR